MHLPCSSDPSRRSASITWNSPMRNALPGFTFPGTNLATSTSSGWRAHHHRRNARVRLVAQAERPRNKDMWVRTNSTVFHRRLFWW
jgi:hypothetical protein